MSNEVLNISCYKFCRLSEEFIWDERDDLKQKAIDLGLMGTVALSPEGVNVFLAGAREPIYKFKEILESYPQIGELWFKESYSDTIPFKKMRVRIRREIIPLGDDTVKPEEHTPTHLSPEELKKWYDEGKDMIILDTRNDYEIQFGTFENAVELDITKFRQFADAVDMLPEDMKEKPVVTFCTGGIRCEKAAEVMARKGFKDVYQLDGGIINYFEKCGGDHWDGDCYVFDERVALDPALKPQPFDVCGDCDNPIPVWLKNEGQPCPHC